MPGLGKESVLLVQMSSEGCSTVLYEGMPWIEMETGLPITDELVEAFIEGQNGYA